MHRFTNRLINERSPYLLQHAHNPVDWWPWGREAFQLARQLDKPIFLSVGYSTCQESFEDEQVAEVMNRYFVNIKVDRETLPNVDRAYMAFLLASNGGGGGWPMSVWMTPDLKPFFAGTYFPPFDKYGRPGFMSVCENIGERWKRADEREMLIEKAMDFNDLLRNAYKSSADPLQRVPPLSVLDKAYEYFEKRFDSLFGGFGGAPKFPTPPQLNFLLAFSRCRQQQQQRKQQATADNSLRMALHTLREISKGGIHDHLAGGFHRYSVDRFWRVPHFEKMLYDQAQLLSLYSDAYRLSSDEADRTRFSRVAKRIIEYCERELRDSDGGAFYAAQDADSLPHKKSSDDESQRRELREGAFALWTWQEIASVLSQLHIASEQQISAMQIFSYRYGIEREGNCQPDGAHQSGAADEELAAQNVLYEKHSIEETASNFSLPASQVQQVIDDAEAALWKYRQLNRPRPHLDDKIVVAWNGLMISGLAKAAQVFRDSHAYEMACKAADFIRNNLVTRTGERRHLLRSYRNGPMEDAPAAAEDYAFLIQGLIDLYHCELDEEWIKWAAELQLEQDELFWDHDDGNGNNDSGGYFGASAKLESDIPLVIKDDHDGAEPACNSVALCNLMRLGSLLGDDSLWQKAEKLLHNFHNERFMSHPYIMPNLLIGLQLFHLRPRQVVIVDRRGSDEESNEIAASLRNKMLRVVHDQFAPDILVLHVGKTGGCLAQRNSNLQAIINSVYSVDGVRAHVCQGFTCGTPVSSADELRRELEKAE